MITSVSEMFVDEGSQDGEGYSFSITWLVKTDSHATGTFEVLNAPGIPIVGEVHRSGRAAVKNRQARKHLDSDLLWNVTANYEPIPTDQPSGGPIGGDSSTTRRPTIQITGERVTKYSDFDYLGFLIRNSAGDQYEGMDEYDGSDMILTIGASLPFGAITEQILFDWRDVVHGPPFFPQFFGGNDALKDAMAKGANAPKFFAFPAFTPRFMDWSTASQQEDNNTRWHVNLKFAISETWLRSRLDEGYYTNPGGGSGNPSENVNPGTVEAAKKRVLDPNGLPSVVPVKLNGAGEKSATPYYRFYQRYKHADLNAFLNLLKLPTRLSGYEFREAT